MNLYIYIFDINKYKFDIWYKKYNITEKMKKCI